MKPKMERRENSDTKWIQKIHMKKGALHEALGIPLNKKIPLKKEEKASHSSDPILRKEANLALTFRGFRK